jgi:GT2 family glycosyltransferase
MKLLRRQLALSDVSLVDANDSVRRTSALATAKLENEMNSMRPPIDVIIPIHDALSDVERSVGSVLSSRNGVSLNCIAVDDASRDPLVRAFLGALERDGRLTVLRNETNLGFPASANRGLALHPDRDVVLLNSDALVFDGWLDRLIAVLRSTPEAATATPMSNNATILSYPAPLRNNDADLELSWAQVDALFAAVDAEPVVIPTGVGFCMAIKRACLAVVGPFDEATFGAGYGEENDFCMRASRLGWVNLAAANVFVWHRGEASFGAAARVRRDRAQATLEQRHPGHAARIAAFIAEDPLRPIRTKIDAARLRAAPGEKIFVVGEDLTTRQPCEAQVITLGRTRRFFCGAWRLRAPGFGLLPNLQTFDGRARAAEIADLLADIGVAKIVIPSSGRPMTKLVAEIRKAGALRGVPVEISAAHPGWRMPKTIARIL